jgi:6-phosphofructokinase 1
MKRAIVAMGGGPTRVINRTLFGIVDEAAKHGIEVLAARHGIAGVLKEQFLPIKPGEPPISTHKALPGAVIGSTRFKPGAEDCIKAFDIFKKRDVNYFFYIGGNDTAETADIVSRVAADAGYELRCFHVPKTIDNDLRVTDHCPGFGSAARFVASAFMGDDCDNRSLPGIKVNVVMGRNAGFLTAAAALARRGEGDGPHLVYLPERPVTRERVRDQVGEVYGRLGRCVVAVSEGIVDAASG